jgi:hypothetical protein
MEAKDKAIALVKKFYVDVVVDFNASKLCALIAVDEILNDYSYMQNVRNANSNQIHSQRVYWQEVKQEIQKL